MPGYEWLIALISVATFFEAGKSEARFSGKDNSFLWAALSIGLSALIVLVFHGKPFVLLAAQIGLFFAIAAFRAARDKD